MNGMSDASGGLRVEINDSNLLISLPPNAGRIAALTIYRGKLIIATDWGQLYEWDGDAGLLSVMGYVPL